MMKHKIVNYISIFFIILLLSILIFSCSDYEPNMDYLGKTSTVIIDLGLPDTTVSADSSVLDHILRFLTPRNAIAQTAPAAFKLITVRINGDDIGEINKVFKPLQSINLNVPSGAKRRFEVTAYVDPDDPSAARSFIGTTVRNLPPDETVNIVIQMRLHETRLVIPDFQKRRIVFMNIMNGNGWLPRTQAQLGFNDFLLVYDIDFDDRGRIYFTNSYNATYAQGGVWMMENMNDLTPQHIFTGQAYGIAVDRVRNLVYFSAGATMSDIYVWNGTTSQLLSSGTFMETSGIDVEQSTGLLYLACDVSGNPSVIKYRQGVGNIADYPTGNSTDQVWDVISKDGYVYATVANISNNRVIRLPANLEESGLIELRKPLNNFIGPKRFVAPMNNRFYVIDEDYADTDDSITSFDSIFDINWVK